MAITDVNVLAFAFNMDKAQFLERVIEVDNFGTTGDAAKTVAVLADEGWMQVYDNLNEMTEFYNAKALSWNYYWNHWQIYSYSPFANAVAFIAGEAGTAPVFGAGDPTAATVNTAYSWTVPVTGTEPVAISVTAGQLPAGLKVEGLAITGTPTAAGASSFTLTARNSAGSVSKQYTITVA